MPNPKILFIIPAYNEEASIKSTIDFILSYHYDYIVINDGSTDNTTAILESTITIISILFPILVSAAPSRLAINTLMKWTTTSPSNSTQMDNTTFLILTNLSSQS